MPTSPAKHAKYIREVWYPKNRAKHIKRVKRNKPRYSKIAREYIKKLKDVPCLDCGNRYPPCVMDFDHVRGKKTINIGLAPSRLWTVERIQKEADKCEIVCANCHRIRTHITRKK